MMKHFSIVLVVVLAILLTTVAVFAAPPARSTVPIEVDRVLQACDGYDVRVHATGHIEITTFFDQEDNRIKEREHVTVTHFIYREGNMDFGLSETRRDNSQTWFDPDTGALLYGHFAGNPWSIQIPGVGPVYKISGPAFFVDDYDNIVKEAGNITINGEALCAYFAS
jgi:hypothetical protein